MKKIIILLIFSILFFPQCLKFSKKNGNANNNQDTSLMNKNGNGIDFEKLRSVVDNSNSIDLDVFVAISLLHKNYISQFTNETANMTEDQQKKYFEQKKKEFFKTIKYTEAQYNAYIVANLDKINEYIASHKEIGEFLTSIN